MEKLNEEQIHFIDKYLLNSGVEFRDVRIEMIDHVATALEERMNKTGGEFYDIFKVYMVENKSALKKQNEITYKLYKSCLKKLFLMFLSLRSLAILVASFLLSYFLIKHDVVPYTKYLLQCCIALIILSGVIITSQKVRYVIQYCASLIFPPSVIITSPNFIKDKYSGTYALGVASMIIFYTLDLFYKSIFFSSSTEQKAILLSIAVTFSFNVVGLFTKYIKDYKTNQLYV